MIVFAVEKQVPLRTAAQQRLCYISAITQVKITLHSSADGCVGTDACVCICIYVHKHENTHTVYVLGTWQVLSEGLSAGMNE